MAGANEYKLFCTGTPGTADSLTPAAYALLTAILANGYQTGTADSSQANTTWRQATMGTAVLAYLVSQSNQDALDNRDIAGFANKLLTALNTLLAPSNFVGQIVMNAGTSIPSKWLRCDGSILLRTDYPALFSAIGTLYNTGVDVSHFALPDMRGMFPRGVDNGRGQDGGRALGSTQLAAYLSHQHTVPITTGKAQPGDVGDLTVMVPGGATNTSSDGGADTRPVNVALNFMIYAGV